MAFTIHPLLVFFASTISFTITAAYTSRNSPLRYVALAFLALCAYVMPPSLAAFASTTGFIGRVGAGATFWNVVTCFDRLILRGWDTNHYPPSKQNKRNKQTTAQEQSSNETAVQYVGPPIDFGSEVTGTPRGIGLFWEVKNVPYFDDMRPSFVPSLGTFLLVQSVAAICSYYFHEWTVETVLSLDRQNFSSTRIAFFERLPEVTFQELQVRTLASLGYWVIQYTMMQFFFSVFAIIAAISHPADIKLWRPMYDSPRHAYTIRNFWGKFWHQNLRSGVEGLSEFFAHRILQLPHKGIIQRYTKIMAGFFVSGIMHNFSDAGGGLSVWESGAAHFFCMQALGIIVEDCIQNLYNRYCKGLFGRNTFLVERAVGHAWVLFFLIWTSPVWVFPAMINMRVEDDLLSLSAVKPVLFGRSKDY